MIVQNDEAYSPHIISALNTIQLPKVKMLSAAIAMSRPSRCSMGMMLFLR